MQIGLYLLKEPFRKFIKRLVPFCKNIHPNSISWSLLPLGILTGFLYLKANVCSEFYLLAILLLFLRMIVATLDGLVAETYQKQNAMGEILNRFVPELCDIILLLAIVSNQDRFKYGSLVLGIAWLSSYTGLIGLVAKKPIQSVGPLGQTDRLATLMLFSLLEYLGLKFGWTFNFIVFFLYWTIIGGLLTCFNRFLRQS